MSRAKGIDKLIEIQVRLYGTCRHTVGRDVIYKKVMDGCTLGQLLELLAQEYGDDFSNLTDPFSGVLIICNGEVTRDLKQKLYEGMRVFLTPAVLGG